MRRSIGVEDHPGGVRSPVDPDEYGCTCENMPIGLHSGPLPHL